MSLDQTDGTMAAMTDESGLSFGSAAIHGAKVTAAFDDGRPASDSGMRLLGRAERLGERTGRARAGPADRHPRRHRPSDLESVLDGPFLQQRGALLRYLRARGAGEDAEDLLQDLWLKIHAAADDEGIIEPLPYLYRMAHNLMIDRGRATARRVARDQQYHGLIDIGGNGADPKPSSERIMIARDDVHQIDAVLAGLGARTDHIFRRHRVEGVTQSKIAEELGITLSGVEKHLQKAYRAVLSARSRLTRGEAAHPLEQGRATG